MKMGRQTIEFNFYSGWRSCSLLQNLISTGYYKTFYIFSVGPGVAQWLRHCATSRAVLRSGTLTEGWLRHWGLNKPSKNPPDRNVIPARIDYIRVLAIDSAYIEQQGQSESVNVYKRRLYNTLQILLRDTTELAGMRITRLWPDEDWRTIWKNLHTAPIPKTTKGEWYRIIHDVIPTNERLHKIRLSTTDRCRLCNGKDTLQHRLIECGDGARIWGWTRERIAAIMRMDPRYISQEWIIRPNFQLWPPPPSATVPSCGY